MKSFACFFLSFLICLSLAACVGAGDGAKQTAVPTSEVQHTELTTGQPSETEPAATDDPNKHYLTYEEVYDPETDFDNYLGHDYSNILETEDAYYFAGVLGDYLYYSDKTTGEYDVLCGKPECMHDHERENRTCNGYIGASGSSISLYKDKIYFARSTATELTFNRMELDGTGREELFVFDKTYRYEPQWSAIHRGTLYGANWLQTVENAEPVGIWNFSRWDIETGDFKLIHEEKMWAEPTMFFFGRYVYLCASYTFSEETEDHEVNYGDTNVKVFRYDTETEQLETILDVTGPDYAIGRYVICVAAENRIYVTPTRADGQIPIYLVSNGELKEAFKVDAFGSISLYADKVVSAGFEQPMPSAMKDRRWRFIVYDYDGNVVLDEITTIDTALGITDAEVLTGGYAGVYEADGAFLVVFRVNTPPVNENENGMKACLVKYELVNGKFEETLIAVANWG